MENRKEIDIEITPRTEGRASHDLVKKCVCSRVLALLGAKSKEPDLYRPYQSSSLNLSSFILSTA